MHMASGITHLALNAIAGCYSDYAHEWEKSKLSYFTSLLLFPSAPGAPPWVFLTHPSAALTNNPAGSSSSAGPYGCCWGLLLLPALLPHVRAHRLWSVQQHGLSSQELRVYSCTSAEGSSF